MWFITRLILTNSNWKPPISLIHNWLKSVLQEFLTFMPLLRCISRTLFPSWKYRCIKIRNATLDLSSTNCETIGNWVGSRKSYVAQHQINTQYMTNPNIVYPVKMEYGWNFSISGLKMMLKSGLEKFNLKSLHAGRWLFSLLNLWFWAFLWSKGK